MFGKKKEKPQPRTNELFTANFEREVLVQRNGAKELIQGPGIVQEYGGNYLVIVCRSTGEIILLDKSRADSLVLDPTEERKNA